MSDDLIKPLELLKEAARLQRKISTEKKNKVLIALANNLELNIEKILLANTIDLENLAPETQLSFKDRLKLDKDRIHSMAESLKAVAHLPDPVNEIVETKVLENNLHVRKQRAPLGIIFMIFESRPNVILEAFSMAFKSGNVILLRGGSESKFTAQILYKIMHETLNDLGFSKSPFLGLENYDRSVVEFLLKQKKYIDIVVPRGGDQLIAYVQKTALMPIIKNDRGLCHVFVDQEADLQMAANIVQNAKVQRPGVCNSMETVLVHESIAKIFLPLLHKQLINDHVTWYVDQSSLDILKNEKNIHLAEEKNWDTEYLDLMMNCKIVKNYTEAINHIEKYGSKHSESIITKSEKTAKQFQEDIDAAVVYWNASTRFTDGFQLGLGGELGISTQKLHVRGPVGLRELTNLRWVIDGTGQIRN